MPPLLSNPHFRAASVLARLVVNWATGVWAIIVLLKPDAIRITAYAWVANYVHEDVIGAVMLSICVLHMIWLGWHLPPVNIRGWPLGSAGYLVIAIFWLFLFYTLLEAMPTQPTAISTVSAICGLAVFAFVSNPRPGDADAAAV